MRKIEPKAEITQKLEAIQEALGESDAEFAQRLGINRTTWILLRTGQRQPGRTVLRGVRNAFPNLDRQILDFLVSKKVS